MSSLVFLRFTFLLFLNRQIFKQSLMSYSKMESLGNKGVCLLGNLCSYSNMLLYVRIDDQYLWKPNEWLCRWVEPGSYTTQGAAQQGAGNQGALEASLGSLSIELIFIHLYTGLRNCIGRHYDQRVRPRNWTCIAQGSLLPLVWGGECLVFLLLSVIVC